MEYIIQTTELTKKISNKTIVSNINLHIKKGDIYGFIGRNGAGKTTTMKLILGLMKPSSGKIQLFNQNNLSVGRKKIGSLIESPGIYKRLSAYENLKIFSHIYGGTDEEIHDILKLIGLDHTGKRKAGNFSLGMKQRLGIGIALLGNPEVLILDEPINGLDPSAIKEVRDTLLKLNKEKQITILISSHLLDELAKITTRYGIINNGNLIEEIDSNILLARCKNKLEITVDNPSKAIYILQSIYSDLEYQVSNQTIFLFNHYEHPEQINENLVHHNIQVSELTFSHDSFEQYFIERIGNE